METVMLNDATAILGGTTRIAKIILDVVTETAMIIVIERDSQYDRVDSLSKGSIEFVKHGSSLVQIGPIHEEVSSYPTRTCLCYGSMIIARGLRQPCTRRQGY
jgi:hypothetical protein